MRNYSYLCTRFRLNGTMTERSFAPVAELVDAPDLGSGVSRRAGSSPVRRTNHIKRQKNGDKNATNAPKCKKIELFYKKN